MLVKGRGRTLGERSGWRLPTARAALALSAGAAAGLLLDAAAADACSYPAPPPALAGYPAEGAVGVPIDVRPIYDGNLVSSALVPRDLTSYVPPEEQPPAFELVDAAGVVTPLAFGTGGGAWFVELVPPRALAPRTRYTVRTIAGMTLGERLQVSFTTGAGEAAPPGRLDAAIEHYTLQSDMPTSCSPWPHGTCVAFRRRRSSPASSCRRFTPGKGDRT